MANLPFRSAKDDARPPRHRTIVGIDVFPLRGIAASHAYALSATLARGGVA